MPLLIPRRTLAARSEGPTVKHWQPPMGVDVLVFCSMELDEKPAVGTAAHLMNLILYSNKNNLMAGMIIAGYDEKAGGSVYSLPLGGGVIKEPFSIGGGCHLIHRMLAAQPCPPSLIAWMHSIDFVQARVQATSMGSVTRTTSPTCPRLRPSSSFRTVREL